MGLDHLKLGNRVSGAGCRLDREGTAQPTVESCELGRLLLHWDRRTLISLMAKSILQGTVKRGRRQSRQRKRWEDNIREWTGLVFAKSQRAVKNR